MQITSISEENISYFERIVPRDILNQSDLLLGVLEDGVACGILGVVIIDYSLNINLLYITESHRRRGAAKMLVNSLLMFASQNGIDDINVSFLKNESTLPLEMLLQKMMFERSDISNPIFKTEIGECAKFFSKKIKESENLINLRHSLSKNWYEFEELTSKQKDSVKLRPKDYYDQEVSFLVVKEGHCKGGVLISREDDTYLVDYLLVKEQGDSIEVLSLMKSSYNAISSRGDLKCKLVINALNGVSEKLIKTISGGSCEEIGTAVTYYFAL